MSAVYSTPEYRIYSNPLYLAVVLSCLVKRYALVSGQWLKMYKCILAHLYSTYMSEICLFGYL